MKIMVFTQSYFEGKVEVDSLLECKRLIHENPDNPVRVQIDIFRLLLHPSKDKNYTREIDGYSDLNLLYRYFNNLTEDGKSSILCHETYINNFKSRCCHG